MWALLIACPSICAAQQVTAITDYLKPIVSKIAADPNAGGWAWETNGNGGYLLRMSMDVTGDGRPEVFVTTSLTSSKHIAEWTVFDVTEAGAMRPYAKSIRLPADSVWPANEPQSSSLVYVAAPDRERERASEERVYPVYRYTLSFPEVTQSLTYLSELEAAKLRPMDTNVLPKLQSILVADYLTDPQAKWSEVSEWKLDANDCFFRPEDKERTMKNTSFTPQAALARLNLAPNTLQDKGAQAPQPVDPATHSKNISDKTVPAAESSSTPWLAWTAVIIAAIGLLWLFLKKRK